MRSSMAFLAASMCSVTEPTPFTVSRTRYNRNSYSVRRYEFSIRRLRLASVAFGLPLGHPADDERGWPRCPEAPTGP